MNQQRMLFVFTVTKVAVTLVARPFLSLVPVPVKKPFSFHPDVLKIACLNRGFMIHEDERVQSGLRFFAR